ncbi:hypothetical protein, partial [uncultured Desulfovibrio sp.]|uniref:hypothetical protein n=1 Tax=uncultured Desulfovibrio sp. TaxID=167968 RepID=UPI002625B350
MKQINCEAAGSSTRPKVNGKTALFSRNAWPYGLKREALQTENALDSAVKLKTCYNLFTYNEERPYGGT